VQRFRLSASNDQTKAVDFHDGQTICGSPLDQIEKAYGPNNAILDNCHVRVCFATDDERTAKRVSDALGMATEMRAMKNYAGHRLSLWLEHIGFSRRGGCR
jgi:type IV secretion system protein VirD4